MLTGILLPPLLGHFNLQDARVLVLSLRYGVLWHTKLHYTSGRQDREVHYVVNR